MVSRFMCQLSARKFRRISQAAVQRMMARLVKQTPFNIRSTSIRPMLPYLMSCRELGRQRLRQSWLIEIKTDRMRALLVLKMFQVSGRQSSRHCKVLSQYERQIRRRFLYRNGINAERDCGNRKTKHRTSPDTETQSRPFATPFGPTRNCAVG